jgi:hypothetical protein
VEWNRTSTPLTTYICFAKHQRFVEVLLIFAELTSRWHENLTFYTFMFTPTQAWILLEKLEIIIAGQPVPNSVISNLVVVSCEVQPSSISLLCNWLTDRYNQLAPAAGSSGSTTRWKASKIGDGRGQGISISKWVTVGSENIVIKT